MNPLRALFGQKKDVPTRIQKAKQEMFDLLKKNRPLGIELPIDDEELSSVAMALVQEQPELEILNTKRSTMTLVFRDDLDPTLSPSTREMLNDGGFLITKGKVNQ